MTADPRSESTPSDRPVWVAPRLERLSSESIRNANGVQADAGENSMFGAS
jgi:hypothetical protein